MPGKSKLTADAAERAALRSLSKSKQRGEADRARAILLTLEGRRAGDFAAMALAPITPKGVAWPHGSSPWAEGPRPRHTLKRRQDAAAVAASRRHLEGKRSLMTVAVSA
jgi:hypothetical protein